MDNIYNGFKSVKALSLNNPYGTHRDDVVNDGKSNILQIEILKKPKNFSERLEFRIKTDLSVKETVQFSIMDSESIWSTTPDKDDTLLDSNTSLRLGSAKYFIQFTEKMQKKAFKIGEYFDEIEGDFAECYIKIYHPKIGTVYSGTFLVEKTVFKKSVQPSLIQPKPIVESPMNYSDEEKAKIISIAVGESKGSHALIESIPWIYFNLTKRYGIESGLSKSSFYTGKDSDTSYRSFRICMYYLGKGQQYQNDIIQAMKPKMTIKQYVETKNGNFEKIMKPALDYAKKYLYEKMFISKPVNPYPTWEGQGYYNDMNIRKIHDYHKIWALASLYLFLQRKGKVRELLVKEFIEKDWYGYDATTYLYDSNKILEFFDNNPNLIPKDLEKLPSVHIEIKKK